MTKQCEADSPELQLLKKIDRRLDGIEQQIVTVERRAIQYGATAGAGAGTLAGGIVAFGISLARAKLGL
ncbi:hypothetical protein [Caballeronia sp. LZ001]|uniref:hypothetical protein n=1 Tax=Caballeronia sp. LZ001 TaxID=3038553 RepID=UPI00285B0C66|nr:hypothetical protein [Caballeronia sp. LZ001]MDR5803417.1 hypothetical protein [Caballeronia sp. LZ001]